MVATPTNPETLYVLVVYENEKNFEDLKSWKQGNPLVKLIPAHAVNFELRLLEEPNPVEALLRDQRSTSGDRPATSGETRISAFVKHVRRYITPEDDGLLPVIFVALGFAALVAMEAVRSEENFIPMGMIVASVSEETATGKSGKFRDWHKKLAGEEADSKQRRVDLEHQPSKNRRLTLVEELAKKDVLTKNEREVIENWLTSKEDPALSALKKVLRQFNDHCRRERIRLSYVFRNKEASHDRWC